MINTEDGLLGPEIVARRLQSWQLSDSPDIINATIQYIAEEWLGNRKASSTAVYTVYAMFRDLGATGDVDAAVIACALEKLLEQHGSLDLSFTLMPIPNRRRSDLIRQTRH